MAELDSAFGIFKEKGWVVEGHLFEEREEVGTGRKVHLLTLTFFRLAPSTRSMAVSKEKGRILPMFSGYGSPCVRVEGFERDEVERLARMFAEASPPLSLPFWAEMCGKCGGQGGDWMFGECRCPVAGGWRLFSDGIPDKCAYSVEQVVSRDERVGIMARLFEGHPTAQRMLRRRI